MSPENIPPQPENHAIDRKTTSQKQPPDQQPMKCPRCDSSNTKFCYYNNYSLTQPRHFCKTCRRYWTRGGALRNVPIGGGCRKTKKLRTSSSSTTSSKLLSAVSGGEFGATAFKFLDQNLNPGLTPATDFQLGGLSLPKLHPATAGVYTQFITSSGSTPLGCGPGTGAACFGLDLMGLNNYPASSTPSLVQVTATGNENHQQQHISISSIESLSSMNQEMHWKLQQQRLAMIYGPSPQNDQNVDNQDKSTNGEINLFKNLEINNNKNNSTSNGDHNSTRKIDVGPTEWLFDQINTTSSPATNYGGNNNVNEASGSTLHGVWGDLQHQHQHHHHHHHQQLHQFNGLQ